VLADREHGLLLPRLQSQDLIRSVGSAYEILPGVTVDVSEFASTMDSEADYQVGQFLFDTRQIESLLTGDFERFTQWLWAVVTAIRPLVIVMPSGSDARSPVSTAMPLAGMADLLKEGRLQVPFPILYISEELAAAWPGTAARRWPPYEALSRKGFGTLYLLVERRPDGSVEILEPAQ
jgi:hypothetical protein